MGKVVSVISQKGGVGKTTTAVNLAAGLAGEGFNTLLVEADPQCSLGGSFGYEKYDFRHGLAKVVAGKATLPDVVFSTSIPRLDIVSSDVWSLEEEAAFLRRFETDSKRLRQALGALRDEYEFLLLDCPPSLGPVAVGTLAASDAFVVPLQAEPYAAKLLPRLLAAADSVRDNLNPSLRLSGILLTMVDQRTNLSEKIVRDVRSTYGDRVFQAEIPRSIRYAELPVSNRPAILAPASRSGAAYRAFVTEFLARELSLPVEEDAEFAADRIGAREPGSSLLPADIDTSGLEDEIEGLDSTQASETAGEGPSFVDLDSFLAMEERGEYRVVERGSSDEEELD